MLLKLDRFTNEGLPIDNNREELTEKFGFITRSLVKNNVVRQNAYIGLLVVEYLSMMFYILRLADSQSFTRVFSPIEHFLDIGLLENQTTRVNAEKGIAATSYVLKKATAHSIINLVIMGVYLLFTLLLVLRLLKIQTFDQTQQQSYIMKMISGFLILTSTVLQMPVFISIFIVIKSISLNIAGSLQIVMIFSTGILICEFSLMLVYSLRFFNLEVPNDEIPWSHNSNSGIYLKVVLKLALCTQELYRESLQQRIVLIIVLALILAIEGLILMYRMNTPNIFNTTVHAATIFLESVMVALTLIGLIALITKKDILSTLAYLFIFIPVIIKIFYAIDDRRKHQVLFKLKNEEQMTSNEYLIALTHLLKMVKRQNEEDIAQLLSFTYYHKLFCYDKKCICQFFTQYCQDPVKFKGKKKRNYQGFVDDGVKLIQEKDVVVASTEDVTMSSTGVGNSEGGLKRSGGGNAKNRLISINPLTMIDQGEMEESDTRIAINNASVNPNQNRQVGFAKISNNGGTVHKTVMINKNPHYSGDDFGTTNLETVQEAGSAHDLTQNELIKFQDGGNYIDDHGDQYNGQSQSSMQYREQGLMAQLVKGDILSGSSYNGYDTNLDFKLKNEFKSPAQFKTIHEGRTYFFTRLLEMMFRQLEARTSKNISFNLIYIFFHYTYQHNLYLAIKTLVSLSKSLKQSFFQKMTFSVSEYYLLELILQEFKKNTKEDIDYSMFIKSNQMSQRLDWLFEDAALDIIQFWSLFKDENANVRKAYELGMQISGNIRQIREYTKTLEEKELIKDYNKYYYYAMFYQNLLNDKQQYNQMVANLKNLIMMRNMRKKSTRFGGGNDDINDLAFAILSYDDDKTVGRFTYCNKIASKIFGVTEERIIGECVLNIMPELVRVNHEMFIKRFQQDGLPRIFGRVRNMFVKDFKDYLVPVQFYINFHYSSQFSYSLILHLDPIESVTYYGSSIQIPVKHCIFFVCNSENYIMNYSINARKILGLSHKVKKEQEEIIGRGLKMEDIVQGFLKMESQIEVNQLRYLPNQILKVKNFRSFTEDQQYIYCSVTFNQLEYLHNYPGNFSEHVYMIVPCNRVPELDQQSNAPTTLTPTTQGMQQQNSSRINSDNQPPSHNLQSQSDQSNINAVQLQNGDDLNPLSMSVSSMSSTSSRNSSSQSLNNTKSLLFSSRSPRVLNLYLYIVFGVFLSFMLITSINFIIYMQKKNSVDLKIQFNQVVNKRNTFLASTILTIKQLHLINFAAIKKNDTQFPSVQQNKSNIFQMSRFELYTQVLQKSMDGLQDYHNQFKQLDQLHASEFGTKSSQFDIFENLNLTLVSERGKLYKQSNTLDFGFSMFVTNLGMVNTSEMMLQSIPLDLKKYLLSKNDSNQVTPLLRSLFFLFENGMTSLNSLSLIQESYIQQNTIKTSDESKLFVNLISFISIGVITLIGIFTFPLLGKIEDRKISVLKFFNLLSVDQITELIQRGKEFQGEFEQMTRGNKGLSVKDNYEEDEMEIIGDMTAQNLTPREAVTNNVQKTNPIPLTNHSSNMPSGRHASSANEISNIIKKIRLNDYNRDKREYLKRKNKEYQKMASTSNQMRGAFDNNDGETGDKKVDKKSKKTLKDKDMMAKYNKNEMNGSAKNSGKKGSKSKGIKMSDDEADQKGSSNKKYHKKNQDNVEEVKSEDDTDSDIEKETKKAKNLKEIQKYDLNKSNSNAAALSSASTRTDQIDVQVEKIALGEKLKLAFYVLVVLAFLNSCLFICFYLGQKTFKDDALTLTDLSTFYHRENCLDNLMLYTLEQFIQNKTVNLDSGETEASYIPLMKDAAEYFMSDCQKIEQDYNALRKNLPSFLIETQQNIENLESSNLCQETFGNDTIKRGACESVYDELMKRGLTSTMYMIFNYAQQLTVRFQKDQGQLRTAKNLQQILYDSKVKDLVDLVTYFLHDSLSYLGDLVTKNALSYFARLANYYMIIFACYMVISVIMSFVFGLVIFKKLKEQIMTSANILAIMPLEELEHKDRHKIEVFLNS